MTTTRGPALRRLLAGAAAAVVLGGSVVASGRPARAADDRDPTPPAIFFPKPDEPAAGDVESILDGTYADASRVAEGREFHVRRFGLWSVPALVARVEQNRVEAATWNSAMTLGSLRRVLGPSPHLWPAIPALVALLKNENTEAYRRSFAALALASFYGPDAIPREDHEEPGAERARKALADGVDALAKALTADHPAVRISAALALGKIGGTAAWQRLIEHVRKKPTASTPSVEVATLLALGMMPSDDGAASRAVSDSAETIRAAGALSIACRVVAEDVGNPGANPQAAAGAASLERLLQPKNNANLRLQLKDGAESTYARGALARLGKIDAAWEDLFHLATVGNTPRETAVAAAQALLFCPNDAVRGQMTVAVSKNNVTGVLEEPVIAAFLIRAGWDGRPAGVAACRRFLRDRALSPRGRAEYDVRYHAAIGLVRAFEEGRVHEDARLDAIGALEDGVVRGLPKDDPKEPRSFRAALEHELATYGAQLRAGGRFPRGTAAKLAETFVEPDGLLGLDPIDVALDRLNDAVRDVYGLNNLGKAASGVGPGRAPNREDQPLRFLLRWLERYPLYTRLDFHRDRGRPAPRLAVRDDPLVIDR